MSIFIATHKSSPTPSSALYKKICLGNSFAKDCDYLDNTGINISHLNREYCELTATYWLWKNCSDDFIGLCHYRRFFNFIPLQSNENIINTNYSQEVNDLLSNTLQIYNLEKLLDRYDLIIPRCIYEPVSLETSYNNSHRSIEWEFMVKGLDLLYGRGRHAIDIDNRFRIGNMIICKKNIFDLYAHQLFFIIDSVFDRLGRPDAVEGSRYQPYRYPGYLAERFTTAFINANKLSFFEAQIINISNF